MNNVKTNRTFEEWMRNVIGTCTPENYARYQAGWNAALESVEKEPALTRRQALTAIIEWETADPKEMNDGLLDRLFRAGRIPAPATVETPQEGELTDDWEEWLDEQLMRIREKRLNLTDAVTLITDRHQQALSAREQAVRTELGQRIEAMQNLYNMADNAIGDLRAELAAEKLANEGKYAIGEAVQARNMNSKGTWIDLIVGPMYPRDIKEWIKPENTRRPRPALTPDEKAEAWVKWWCEKEGYKPEYLGWKELATRQANGETIEQIYAEVEGRKG